LKRSWRQHIAGAPRRQGKRKRAAFASAPLSPEAGARGERRRARENEKAACGFGRNRKRPAERCYFTCRSCRRRAGLSSPGRSGRRGGRAARGAAGVAAAAGVAGEAPREQPLQERRFLAHGSQQPVLQAGAQGVQAGRPHRPPAGLLHAHVVGHLRAGGVVNGRRNHFRHRVRDPHADGHRHFLTDRVRHALADHARLHRADADRHLLDAVLLDHLADGPRDALLDRRRTIRTVVYGTLRTHCSCTVRLTV